MTSEMPITVDGKKIIAKIGGYTGKTEATSPIQDIKKGYMIWLSLVESKKVPDIGSRVTVKIGGKKFGGKIIGGPKSSRYGKYKGQLKKILLDTDVGQKLSESKIRKLHKRALRKEGRL